MWLATSRYGIEQAPAGFGFVHDFLNTLPHGRPAEEDLLANAESAERWLSAALSSWSALSKRRVSAPKLASADAKELRGLRGTLHQLLSHPEPSRSAASVLELPVAAQLRADGSAQLLPMGSGWKFVGSLLLLEITQAQNEATFRRLKACRNEPCGCVFFDRSKNNSAVWHSSTACGNTVNLRASRARRREEQA